MQTILGQLAQLQTSDEEILGDLTHSGSYIRHMVNGRTRNCVEYSCQSHVILYVLIHEILTLKIQSARGCCLLLLPVSWNYEYFDFFS